MLASRSEPFRLGWQFMRAVLLSFSGFATVPLLRDAIVVDEGLLTKAELNDANRLRGKSLAQRNNVLTGHDSRYRPPPK